MAAERKWLPEELVINQWEDIKPYFEELLSQNIESKDAFSSFLSNLNELEAFISEDMAWRYIKMTCDTTDKEIEEKYLYFVKEIQPQLAPYDDKINRKINNSAFLVELEKEDKAYFIYFRDIRKSIELYREKNIPLQAEIAELSQQYGSIAGAMSVNYAGKELTLQQASLMLQENNRELRKEIYELISKRRYEDREKLDLLFNQLIEKRNHVATNADFKNYRDYNIIIFSRIL